MYFHFYRDIYLYISLDYKNLTMWPSQGPPPPVASTNPAYPPGYPSPCPPAAPGVFPQPSQPCYPPGQYAPGQYPPYQYPGMGPNPLFPYGTSGVPYPPAPGGYPHVPACGVPGPCGQPGLCGHPGRVLHPPKGYHYGNLRGHHRCHPHHYGVHPRPGGLAAGVVAVGMGLMGHKAHKKMKKKMKKAHKAHKYWHGKVR